MTMNFNIFLLLSFICVIFEGTRWLAAKMAIVCIKMLCWVCDASGFDPACRCAYSKLSSLHRALRAVQRPFRAVAHYAVASPLTKRKSHSLFLVSDLSYWMISRWYIVDVCSVQQAHPRIKCHQLVNNLCCVITAPVWGTYREVLLLTVFCTWDFNLLSSLPKIWPEIISVVFAKRRKLWVTLLQLLSLCQMGDPVFCIAPKLWILLFLSRLCIKVSSSPLSLVTHLAVIHIAWN